MRVVLDRNRGASYLAMFLTGIGMFGVFLFLTYFMRVNLGLVTLRTGTAFLPMIGALMFSAAGLAARLQTRVTPKILVSSGMLLAALGMGLLTSLSVTSTYASGVLPSLIIIGLGLGLVFGPGMNNATSNVDAADAGVASATVNAVQQIGGSIGTAFLSTMAASSAASYVASHSNASAETLQAVATVHGYTTVFWIATSVYIGGAIIAALLFRPGVPADFRHANGYALTG